MSNYMLIGISCFYCILHKKVIETMNYELLAISQACKMNIEKRQRKLPHVKHIGLSAYVGTQLEKDTEELLLINFSC